MWPCPLQLLLVSLIPCDLPPSLLMTSLAASPLELSGMIISETLSLPSPPPALYLPPSLSLAPSLSLSFWYTPHLALHTGVFSHHLAYDACVFSLQRP
jgi:hypothetical protein